MSRSAAIFVLAVQNVSELPPSSVSASRASVVRLMIPTDANFMGNVFGGQILSEVDRVAYITATRHAKENCVTASIDRVDFIQPVHVGEVVGFDAQLTYVGHSSMGVWVVFNSEALAGGGPRRVGEAYVTMVAVDAQGRPVPVPRLLLSSEQERIHFEEGRRRMELRQRTRAAPAGRS
jgi:acyl-CoA hydrolase